MNISSFSVRRPVTVAMIFLALALFGGVMYFRLPVELMPNVSYKTITVNIQARGGIPPTEVESLILKYLLARGDITGREISEQIRIPFVLLDQPMRQLKSIVSHSSFPVRPYMHWHCRC